MPELPEVEVARRNLERWLRGARITVAALSPRLFHGGSARAFAAKLCGRTLKLCERKGKWLRLVFSGEPTLFSHLGMTGKWVLRGRADPAQRFERARLDAGARSVRYLDPRLFGKLYGYDSDEDSPRAWRELGPDALRDGIDIVQLHHDLSRRGRSIKETLLDQTLIAGVGNIQAAEALWRARLNPLRPAASLSRREVAALAAGITGSIHDTLAREDGPEITYVEEAGADNPFDVYGKEGEPCPRCGRKLTRVVQGGRATVFCPRCQPARRRAK
jgi:formamidopyrimidine-DNA glycosylase